MATTAPTHTPAYLSNLTPLWGIAALIVLFFHFDLFWSAAYFGMRCFYEQMPEFIARDGLKNSAQANRSATVN